MLPPLNLPLFSSEGKVPQATIFLDVLGTAIPYIKHFKEFFKDVRDLARVEFIYSKNAHRHI